MTNTRALEDGWIDVTQMLHPGITHWPGDPDYQLDKVCDMARDDSCNVSKLTMCVHTGTHIDAPRHYLPEGTPAHEAPLDAMIGLARLLEFHEPVAIRRAWLEQFQLRARERIIIKTAFGNPNTGPGFSKDYIYIAQDAAQYLADLETRLVGIDTMSVGGFYDSMTETHVTLLGAGCWVVENLDLQQVSAGNYELLCLPMKLKDSDGAPARVLMRPV